MDNMTNTSAEGTQTSTEGTQQGRTFTQEDVNRIVQERLAKEKGKHDEELNKRAAELDRREKRMDALEQLKAKNLPEELVDLVNLESDEAFEKSINLLEKTYKAHSVGSTAKISGATPATGTGAGDAGSSIRKAMGLG